MGNSICNEEKKEISKGRENKIDESKDNNINNTENINLDSMAQNANQD